MNTPIIHQSRATTADIKHRLRLSHIGGFVYIESLEFASVDVDRYSSERHTCYTYNQGCDALCQKIIADFEHGFIDYHCSRARLTCGESNPNRSYCVSFHSCVCDMCSPNVNEPNLVINLELGSQPFIVLNPSYTALEYVFGFGSGCSEIMTRSCSLIDMLVCDE